MELTFAPRNVLQMEDARIIFRNFRGEPDDFDPIGSRKFSVVIPTEEMKDALVNDLNRFGVGWNVKIRAPREEGETPFMHLPVKVKYTERSKPRVFLISGRNKIELDEDTIGMLDDIDIASVALDIRPYDGEARMGAFRTAYLQSMYVVQNVDRLAARFEEFETENY